MARPMTAAQTRAAMVKWDVRVQYRHGWENRGRPDSTAGGAFRPIGIMIHHTGSDSQSNDYIDWLFLEGRPRDGMPAPLAQVMTGMDGITRIGATGKANHAGKGSTAIYNKTVAETISLTKEEIPGPSVMNGNPFYYGDEVMFDGGQPMTAAQWNGVVRWAAAVCDHHKWNAGSIIGHGEWTKAKWDPGLTDMSKLRRDVETLLKLGPKSPVIKPPVTPIPIKNKLDPKSYVLGGKGEHVYWLTERLNLHGIKIAKGTEFNENVRNAVAQFQQKQGWRGSDSDGFPGVTSLKLLAAAALTPVATTDVKVFSWNIAAYDTANRIVNGKRYTKGYGSQTKSIRVSKIATRIKKEDPTLIAFQEISADMLALMDTALPTFSRVKLPTSGKGRQVYTNRKQNVRVIASEVQNVKHMLRNDTKEFVLVAYEKDGKKGVQTSFHTENEGKAVQKLQIKDVLNATVKFAGKHGIKYVNVVVSGDGNRKEITVDVRAWNWRSAAEVAKRVIAEQYHSTNGWKGLRTKGRKIDVNVVRHNAIVIESEQLVLDYNLESDHYAQTVTLTLQ